MIRDSSPLSCACIKHFVDDRTDGLFNDGTCVRAPHYVKNTVFLCGYKDSYFPLHCMIGPDWVMMVATSLAIIVPSIFFLVFISENISRYLTIADGILVSIVVVSHWVTACTDPGTVYCHDPNLYGKTASEEMVDVETGVDSTSKTTTGTTTETPTGTTTETPTGTEMEKDTAAVAAAGVIREASVKRGSGKSVGSSVESQISILLPLRSTPPVRMECNICRIVRPATAKHCYTCGTCVDHMDHHCPFTGKCIARKNYLSFQVFAQLVGLHTYVVIGASVYYLVAKVVVPSF